MNASASLSATAQANKGTPFIFFPPHEISPHTPKEKTLFSAYKKAKSPFLLGAAGLGGVYSGDTHWLIPPGVGEGWIRKHLGDLIAVTDLIPTPTVKTWIHSGELGDIIAALPIIRAGGGGRLVITNHDVIKNPEFTRKMEGPRYAAIEPLLRAQPYLTDVTFERSPCRDGAHDFSTFREVHSVSRSLTASQAAWLGIGDVDMSPWIEGVDPDPASTGQIVVARSARYHNSRFPWPYLVRKHGGRMLFIGTTEEHAAFVRQYGGRVPHVVTQDLMAVASVIKGSALFIGNQSSPAWCAMGMGHPLIQETHQSIKDAIVPRPNAQYADGNTIVEVPGLPFQL